MPPHSRSPNEPPRAKRTSRYAFEAGLLLAYVTTAKGEVLTLDGRVWALLTGPLEYSPNVALRTDGHGRDYAKINTLLPRPIGGARPTHELARLVMALHLIAEASREGTQAARSGWSVAFINGDSRDLRLANLGLVADPGAKFHAVWDLEERFKLLAEGRPITAEWKARKKAGDVGDASPHLRQGGR